MATKRFIDNRALREMIDKSKHLSNATIDAELAAVIEPIAMAHIDDPNDKWRQRGFGSFVQDDPKLRNVKGYIVTNDGRPFLRVVTNGEAVERFGVETVTVRELRFFVERMVNMPDIENAAILAQTQNHKLFEGLKAAMRHINGGTSLSKKEVAAIGAVMHEIQQELNT